MAVTANELKADLERYLLLAEKEDIDITAGGRIIARLVSPYKDRLEIAESLFGVIPAEARPEEALDERISRI